MEEIQNGQVVRHAWERSGLETLTYPSGQEVSYRFDALGRAREIGYSGRENPVVEIGYLGDSRIAEIRNGNGTSLSYDLTPETPDLDSVESGVSYLML